MQFTWCSLGEAYGSSQACSKDWRLLCTVLHLSREPNELLQWVFYDASTINIFLGIIIITIFIFFYIKRAKMETK